MSRRLPSLPILFGAALVAASCGGGPKHVGEITPVVTQRLAGPWALNENESDDPEQAMRPPGGPGGERPGGEGRRPAGGGQPGVGGRGGGMAGGPPGGGRMGGRRPGGAVNRAAMQAIRRIATVAPRTLELAVSDSLVTLYVPREEPWVLPFGEKVKRQEGEDVEIEAKAEWKAGRLVVTRSASGGGYVSEMFMPSVDGRKLTVDVQISLGPMGGDVEFHRVYDARAKTSP